MDAKLINPFINSTINVLKMMAQTDPEPGKPSLKQNNLTWGVVTGLIGMAGEEVNGNLVISFDEPSILRIVSNLLGSEFSEINDDVIDAVGEITNMVSGGTKKELSDLGYDFDMASPIMITGQSIAISQLSKAPVITIPFNTGAGEFVVEANLAKKKSK